MRLITKIKCLFGFHWWLKPSQEPDTTGLLGYRLPIEEICGSCKKKGKILYWIEKKYSPTAKEPIKNHHNIFEKETA